MGKEINKKHCQSGFTMVELLVVMMILSMIISVMVGVVNWQDRTVKNAVTELKNSLTSIEGAYTAYAADKNAYPTEPALTDATFIGGKYLYIPKAPSPLLTTAWTQGSVTSIADSGFAIRQTAGTHFVCVGAGSVVVTDTGYLVLKNLATELPVGKAYYNTTCGATSSMADPGAATTVYLTYWMIR